MNKFRVGDRVKFKSYDGYNDCAFEGKKGVVTEYDPNGQVRWEADDVIKALWRTSSRWNSPEEDLILDGPREKYTTNVLGDFPKKEA
jgi:hypothetical protein